MSNWFSQRMSDDHRAEMFQQAEKDRLVREFQAANGKRQVFDATLIVRLADHLVRMCNYLRVFYTTHSLDLGSLLAEIVLRLGLPQKQRHE